MKISVQGIGIMAGFTRAIGARVSGRFVYIPESKGGGFITGFNWDYELRMMIRNYYLKEDVVIEWTNELMEQQEHVVFLLSGVFPSPAGATETLQPEKATVQIAVQEVSSLISMPAHTIFGSIVIGATRQYLQQHFGHIAHPVIASVLEAGNNFVLETGISSDILSAAGDMLQQRVPESLERQYYKLRCEELLCYIIALLMQRDAVPLSKMHIEDIKAIYVIKQRLQANPDLPPDIASLAKEARMSEPKLRKLFRQTFGKGVFEYYQSMRMQEAARLLREKRLTVSEVGYQLGFSNLSHFTRVFEQHIGMKPKKYSAGF